MKERYREEELIEYKRKKTQKQIGTGSRRRRWLTCGADFIKVEHTSGIMK